MIDQRLAHLHDLLGELKVDAAAFNPGPSLTYLTGMQFHLMERPTVLIVKPGIPPVIILPELEAGKLADSRIEVQPFPFGDNPAGWPRVFADALAHADLARAVVAIEPTRIRFLEMNFLKLGSPSLELVSGEPALSMLRVQKDAGEITAMRQAVKIAQAALQNTLALFKINMTEKELASELLVQLFKAGSGSELPFLPIVASGPNSANPHAAPTDRQIQAGDFLVIDYGASHKGYFSDITRTFAVGEVSLKHKEIYSAVLAANEAGRRAGKPGLAAGKVDEASRKVIIDAGYGPQFTHRTGHGLGMEDHEEPYIFSGNDLILQEGMAYTVEPGIYIPGFGGVRIEDNMVVTSAGSESLSDLPRELIEIG
jgi:Xaa-Pro dipeptidase